MAERYEPLQIDLEGLFAAIDETLYEGGRIGDLFENAERADELDRGRVELIEGILKTNWNIVDPSDWDIEKKAIFFKAGLDSWRADVLGNSTSSAQMRLLAGETKLEDLAKAAEGEYVRRARLLGEQVSNSYEYETLGSEAYRWGVISMIVRAASDIQD